MRRLRGETTIPVYWIIVGFCVMVISPMLSILVSAHLNQRAIETAEAAKRTAQATALVRYCRLIGAQVDVYSEAESPVGQAAYDAWLAEYRLSGCQPAK